MFNNLTNFQVASSGFGRNGANKKPVATRKKTLKGAARKIMMINKFTSPPKVPPKSQ